MDLRRDGFVLGVGAICVIMLTAALTGSYQAFGYGLVAFVGLLTGLGFARRDRITWVPPLLATSVLLVSLVGLFANQGTAVRDVGDTVLGFQAGTAFLIYGVWIPAFFTMALGFAWVFDRLGPPVSAGKPAREGRR